MGALKLCPEVDNSFEVRVRELDELVINWHVNESCNYKCQYCFAKWNNQRKATDIVRDEDKTVFVLKALSDFFDSQNLSNPLRKNLKWKATRLNIAGGEPMLYKKEVLRTLRIARSLGFSTSIITNGSYLDLETLRQYAPVLDTLGISIDSADADTNREIGRVDGKGKVLDFNLLERNLHIIRAQFPHLKLKLNTVVSKHNHLQDYSKILESFNPDKWKVFRVLPIVNDSTEINELQFQKFIRRHRVFSEILFVEDNFDMTSSYIMLDPKCRFFQNTTKTLHTDYQYSDTLLVSCPETAFSQIQFSPKGFHQRYKK